MSDTPKLHGITAYVMVPSVAAAVEFYRKAFDATEVMRMPADDGSRVMHCHLRINGADLLICDPFPEHGFGFVEGRGNVTLHLAVDDVDGWYDKAVAAGAEGTLAPHDAFWGDRYAQVVDPSQQRWAMIGPKKG
jgi:PhnB protein